MLKYTLPLVALLGLVIVVPLARAADAPAMPDTKFVMNAYRGGLLEVALGKVATEKASSEDVKKFGQLMVDDHSKANDELKSLADSKKIDLTKAEASAKKRAEGASQKFSKLEGADFDKAYMALMVKDHEQDVKEFEKESKDGEDADIKAFAAKTLPTLQKHLDMAKELSDKVGKPAGGGGGAGGGEKAKGGPTDSEAKKAPSESGGEKKD
jgi:putative membrane protein